MNYELNNNGELDNGMLINTKTETISSSVRNSTLMNNKGYFMEEEIINLENKNINNNMKDNCKKGNDTKDKVQNILNKIQNLGYDINYVKDCLKNNEICHYTAVYYLMMNYKKY